jgi:hypothetical protein
MFRAFGNGRLYAPEGDDKGAGGNGSADDGKPKPLTEEDVGRIVNAAVTGHLGRALPKAIQEGLKGLNLDELIGSAVKKHVPEPKPDDGAGDKADSADKLTLKALQKQLASVTETLETEKKARTAAEQRAQETEQHSRFQAAQNAFRAAIQPKIRTELLEVLVRDTAGQGRLKVDDNGNAVLRVSRAPFKGAPEQDEDLPLDEAVPLFLAEKYVAPFIPAPGGPADRQSTTQKTLVFAPKPGDSESDVAAQAVAALRAHGIDPCSL